MPQSILDRIGLSTGTDKASGGHNYLDFYEDNLNFFQNETFTMLEIGGLNGASLAMWSKYFPNARVVCVDINPAVKQFEAGQRRRDSREVGYVGVEVEEFFDRDMEDRAVFQEGHRGAPLTCFMAVGTPTSVPA